jgi:hypothetical protein
MFLRVLFRSYREPLGLKLSLSVTTVTSRSVQRSKPGVFRYMSTMAQAPKYTNRLAKEKSPYLLVRFAFRGFTI